jgi:hypothetical protein
VVAKTLTPLAPADAQGRSQNAGALPIGNVPPGSYTLRVSVADGTGVQTRDAPFVVAE